MSQNWNHKSDSPENSNRRSFIFTGLSASALVALSGCGFSPLHAKRGDGRASFATSEMAAIQIALIEERVGQVFRNHLLDEITPRGAPPRPRYRLDALVAETLGGTNLESDASATRFLYRASSSYRLVDLQNDKVILSGNARATRSFNLDENASSVFRTITSRENARDLATKQLSRDIATRIAAYFGRSG